MYQVLLILFLTCSLALFGEGVKPVANQSIPYEASPYGELDLLIASTKKLVEKQEALKATLVEYMSLQGEALKDPNNRPLIQKAAKVAEKALETIKEERLTYLFEPAFISELTLFAKLAKRPTIQPVP